MLHCSENYLEPVNNCINCCFPTVKTLICGSMRLTWSEIVKLSEAFPNLEELRVPSNNISCLDTPVDNNFKQLKVMDLEDNNIEEWEEICKLSVIPTLEHLIIENVRLKSIRFRKCENQGLDIFENLRRLALSNNLISDVRFCYADDLQNLSGCIAVGICRRAEQAETLGRPENAEESHT